MQREIYLITSNIYPKKQNIHEHIEIELTTIYLIQMPSEVEERAPPPITDSQPGSVFSIACEEDNCRWVYVGGSFNYHGRDRIGAIAKVRVDRLDADSDLVDNSEPTLLSVGGGLWFTDDNNVPSEPGSPVLPWNRHRTQFEGRLDLRRRTL